MAKKGSQYDVLILGEHASAYVAAAVLCSARGPSVAHVSWPKDPPGDRLVLISPKLFALHKLLTPTQRQLDLTPVYGLQFLGPAPQQRIEHRDSAIMAYVGSYAQVRKVFRDLAGARGVALCDVRRVEIAAPDQLGVSVKVGRLSLHPRALVLAERPEPEVARRLGIPQVWPAQILYRYSFVMLDRPDWPKSPSRPVVPMCLDLHGQLLWSWMLFHGDKVQLAVRQPLSRNGFVPPGELLRLWANLLSVHGAIGSVPSFADSAIRSIDMPLAGALEQEAVGDRTLLIGPAGGFCSVSGEDLYPACWSAIHAADVLRKALRETHLQDALQSYRHKWRTTLGDYLRGPQQNLRFLLPLVYGNQVMATRMAESILTGRSVVR